MLTQITVSGYKSLQPSTARFAPFTVIVGRNNVGKSNLFDALRLLSNLAQMPVAGAFKPERHRGDPVESFFSEKQPRLSIQCDFDLTGAPDPFAGNGVLPCPHLHYEVEIAFQNGVLEIQSEKLAGRTPPDKNSRLLVATISKDGKKQIALNCDAAQSGKTRHFPSPSPRSVMTMVDDAELYPHTVALARELNSWRFFH